LLIDGGKGLGGEGGDERSKLTKETMGLDSLLNTSGVSRDGSLIPKKVRRSASVVTTFKGAKGKTKMPRLFTKQNFPPEG